MIATVAVLESMEAERASPHCADELGNVRDIPPRGNGPTFRGPEERTCEGFGAASTVPVKPNAMLHSTVERIDRIETRASARPAAAALPRWLLFAVTAVAAMVPGYTLRVFPLLTIRGAKINLEDFLVLAAVASAVPLILRAVRTGQREVLWVPAFVLYMAVPFGIGLRDPGGTFLAVREFRPLSFYLAAAAYACVGLGRKDFHALAATYVASTCVAAVTVFLQLFGVIALPGNQPVAPFVARYLEWTVPVVAFTLALGGAFTDETRRARLMWAASLPLLVWYLVAMQERTTQGLALAIAVVLPLLRPFGTPSVRRVGLYAASAALVLSYGTGILQRPVWIALPVTHMVAHWSRAATDTSMLQRVVEFRTALPRFLHDPGFGVGLGGVTDAVPPDNGPGGPWRYMSTGYGFLLIKTGLIGFGMFVWIAVTALRVALRRRDDVGERPAWPRFGIAAAGLIVLLALNIFHPAVATEEGAIAFALFYGMVMSPAA
jgi:hypothetical protein